MNNRQIDILQVLNYTDYLEPKEIKARLKVECDRAVSTFQIINDCHYLRDRGWLESEPVRTVNGLDAQYRIWGYRKIKNGSRIPEKKAARSGILKLFGVG